MTNYERIKNMTVDEMEEFLCGLCADVVLARLTGEPMRSPNKQWLDSEVEVK